MILLRPTILTLLLLVLSPWAAANSTVIVSGETSVQLQPYLSYWLPEKPIDLSTASAVQNAGNFHPTTSLPIAALDRDVWYRFTVNAKPPYESLLVLNFGEILYDQVEVFFFRQGQWQSLISGMSLPYEQRPLDYRFFAFPILIDANTDSVVYFRVHSLSKALVAPYLQSQQKFFSGAVNQTIISVAIFGSMIGMIMYVLLVARVMLSPIRLFVFVGFLSSVLLNMMFLDGLLTHVTGNWPELSRILLIIINVAINTFSLLFCRYFFDLANTHKGLNHLSNLLIAIFLGILTIAVIFGPEPVNNILPQLTPLVLLIMIIVGIRAMQNKVTSSGYYVAAIICYILAIIYSFLVSTGNLELHLFTRIYTYMGTLALALFMTLAIARQLSINRQREVSLGKKAVAAEARDKAKSDFLATMSHEIRTPINGVLGMAQLLNESQLDSTQGHYVDILLSSAKNLLHVINDILDLSKVEAGMVSLEHIYFNLDQLLTYTVTTFGQANNNRPIKFGIDIKHPIPFYIKGDPSRLQQVISNLLSNAFKFTERGLIKVTVEAVSSADSSQADGATIDDKVQLKFSITDTGPGIPKNLAEQLFEPYTQADQSTTRKFGGTGLGLAICKNLVELMHGNIGMDSQLDKGSTFWFTARFCIDHERQQALTTIVKSLQNHQVALVFSSSMYIKNICGYFDYLGINASLFDYEMDLDKVDFNHIDILLLSNTLGTQTQRWFEQANEHNIKIILFDNVTNNTIDAHDPRWSSIKFIKPPSSTSQTLEAIGQLLSDTDVHRLSQALPQQPGKDLTELKVLVAEDNLINTKVILAMLDKYQIEVDHAENGKQAIDLFREKMSYYDLILMDCEMPEVDGFVATERIREIEFSENLDRTTIYALTAHAMEENKLRCIATGMDGVLTKPLRKKTLMELLESLVS